MAVFNVSFLNPKLRKGSGGPGVGILADQLQILQNELGKDGYLSPGDYDVLIKRAREIQTGSPLTPAQRSEYDVKISNFEKSKEVSLLENADDIEKLNRTMKSEAAEDVMMVGNNPLEFLKGRTASVQAKLNDLSEVIERRRNTGQDTTQYQNEYQAALSDYSEKLGAVGAMEGFDGNNPILGYVAYVTTNEKGEIVDVDYAKHGSKSGYAETNSMVDGFQVYGKINFKREGKNYFVLGKDLFSAPDMMTPDPNVPGSFKPNKLVANVTQRGPISVGAAGYINISGKDLQVQSYIPNNSWAKGVNGTVYKRRDDGGYSKYINLQSNSSSDIPPIESMLTLPTSYEQSLMRNVDETVDASAPIMPDTGMDLSSPQTPINQNIPSSPLTGAPYQAPAQVQPENQPMSVKPRATKTPKQPKTSAPETFGSTMQRTVKSGIDYLKKIF